MSNAKFFGMHVMAYCQVVWPDDLGMVGHHVDIAAMSFSNFIDSGSHKHIPADRLSEELGFNPGSGVFGYLKFSDGSYLLKASGGHIASWDGGDSKPELILPVEPSKYNKKKT